MPMIFLFIALFSIAHSEARANVCGYHPEIEVVHSAQGISGRILRDVNLTDSRGRAFRFRKTANNLTATIFQLSIVRNTRTNQVHACLLHFEDGASLVPGDLSHIPFRGSLALLNTPERGISPKESGNGLGIRIHESTSLRREPKESCYYWTQRWSCRRGVRGRSNCQREVAVDLTACRNGETELRFEAALGFSVVDAAGRTVIEMEPPR